MVLAIAADTCRDPHPPSPCTSITHVSRCRRKQHTDERGIKQRNDNSESECAFAPPGPAARPAASTVLLVGLGELQLYIQDAQLPRETPGARRHARPSSRAARRRPYPTNAYAALAQNLTSLVLVARTEDASFRVREATSRRRG